MLHLKRIYTRNRIESLSTVDELTYSATRNLMITTAVFFLISILIIGGSSSTFVINVLFAVLGILLLFLLKGMRGICGEAVAEKLALDADSGVKCP